jgi:hypothetical protein
MTSHSAVVQHQPVVTASCNDLRSRWSVHVYLLANLTVSLICNRLIKFVVHRLQLIRLITFLIFSIFNLAILLCTLMYEFDVK